MISASDDGSCKAEGNGSQSVTESFCKVCPVVLYAYYKQAETHKGSTPYEFINN